MSRSWTLENVEATSAEYPDTFFIPAQEERRHLAVGRLVRLHFVLADPPDDGPRAERMWVEVHATTETGYLGVLTNRPAYILDLSPGDVVEFGPQHVARTFITKDDPRWHPNMEMKALVSENVIEGACCWLYREAPDRPEDSGWRLFGGDETEEQLEDSSRVRVCNVAWLCDLDPSLEPILRMQEGAFEREHRGAPWQRVEDFTPRDD